jgi:pyruvate kinase
MLLKQTKIVASISDRRCDVDFIKQLFEAGMNVVRMNTAHASREGFEALIANVRVQSYCDSNGYERTGSPYDCQCRTDSI